MDPIYTHIPPYPYPRDQIHCGPNYYQGTEPFPTHMYTNTRPPLHYDYQPWGSDYCQSHTSSVVCHSCCNHSHFPTHYATWGPPYPHFPPSYPPFPAQYMPYPHYVTEHPRVGFETNVPRDHHCCGCPNHVCHQKEQKSVKIEEEEPDREGKMNAPFQLKNSPPYPIVWLPPDYSNDKEHGKPVKLDTKDGAIEAKPHENQQIVEQKPSVWNGWYPFDLNNSGLPKKKGQKEPSRVIWMPYKPEEKENEPKGDNVNPKPSLESLKGSGEHTRGQVSSTVKDIPVKHLEQEERNVDSRNKDKGMDASLKDNGPKRKSSSPPKSSKLPPVCLRVDPLPRKKCSNGISQSPSSPGAKKNQNQNELSIEENKVLASSTKEKQDKGVTKTIKVVDGNTSQEENKHVNMVTTVKQSLHSQDDVPRNQIKEENKNENTSRIMKGQSIDDESPKGEKGEHMKAKGSRTKDLSKEEAAIIIQAVYRGYQTRRWEPVKKLKQIAKVREQMAEVKQLIQAVELSSDTQGNKKQRTIIAEIIMSLLLNLDTIQGFHPSIREVRKSVVRELVGLQEKLDSLFVENSGASPGQEESVKENPDGNEASSGLVESCHNPLDGESLVEVTGPSSTIEKDVHEELSESRTAEGTDSATEPIIKIETEQSNEDLNEESSVANKLEDSDNSGCGQCSECSISQANSGAEELEFAPNNENMPGNAVVELLEEEIGYLHTHQGTDHGDSDVESSKVDRPKQQEDGLPEGYVTSEWNNEIRDESNKEYVGLPDECFALPQEHLEVHDHSETSDKRELSVSEDRNGKDATCNMLHENGVSDTKNSLMLEKAEEGLHTPPSEEQNSEQGSVLDTPPEEEQNTEQGSSLVDDSVAGVTGEVSDEEKTIQVIEPSHNEIEIHDSSNEVCKEENEPTLFCEEESEPTRDSSIEACEGQSEPILEPNDNFEACGTKTAAGKQDNYDELKESNEKLFEETERLRDMMERLIKSGQEQLSAISSLSGRVNDLERKLSRKKKLKIKRSKGCNKPGLFSMAQMYDS